ncbi:ATP-binding protein [Streptacidiphilus melanogenes]|uniref:ATP-binding protein n=1 Tax=Streptacidiphilus melanogenes TaxID=411235 RepID=UPI000693CBE1|nr:ATP-binding protein [Streptacidiphilus melanogenes]
MVVVLNTESGHRSSTEGSVPAAVRPPYVVALDCAFPVGVRAATDARRSLRLAFHEAVAPDALSDAEVVLTELVANSVTASHIDAIVSVVARQLVGSLLIEVTDSCERPPRRRDASALDEEGRGLHLVAQLSRSWGWYPEPQGKTVWALLPGFAHPHGGGHGESDASPPVHG